MLSRSAEVHWQGGSHDGKGLIRLGSDSVERAYSYNSRFGDGPGTNPEELVCAALASCFTMALASILERSGHAPRDLTTMASVQLIRNGSGFRLSPISLHTVGIVPGIEDATFQKMAHEAKRNCPIALALDGVQIQLEAILANKADVAAV